MAPTRPFPQDPALTAIAIGFRNADMIADAVLPRVTVNSEKFKYRYYAPGQFITIPDTTVGRRGRVNTVNFSSEERTASTQDRGLEDTIPQSDINEAARNGHPNPANQSTQFITNMIMLDRERRVAETVFGAATYAAGNQTQLSGTSQFSHVDSDPLEQLADILDGMLMRANVAVMGQRTWSKLRRHPKVVKAVHGNSGDEGMASRQAVAELLEISRIEVGQGWINTAKKGQDATPVRVWGPHMALLHLDPNATNENGATFGYTAQVGGKIAGQWEDKDIGLQGGQRVRVGEQVEEVVSAPDYGFLVEDAVAV